MQKKFYFKNLGLELKNFQVFLKAALMFRDKKMRMIVWGTVVRQVKVYFFEKQTIEYIKKHRKGECVNCITCCQFIRRCPYLTVENKCAVYENRHLVCRIYPVSDYDIQLVSNVSDKKCGYYFD